MEIEIESSPKYESVRSNAYWSRVHLDTSFLPDEYDLGTYKAHLQDCKENPTVGLLAGKKYITGKPMNYPEYAHRNLNYLERQPEIDMLKKSINKKIKTLYPKTRHLREYIIENKRVVLDYTEKSKKYTKFDKLMILFKKII